MLSPSKTSSDDSRFVPDPFAHGFASDPPSLEEYPNATGDHTPDTYPTLDNNDNPAHKLGSANISDAVTDNTNMSTMTNQDIFGISMGEISFIQHDHHYNVHIENEAGNKISTNELINKMHLNNRDMRNKASQGEKRCRPTSLSEFELPPDVTIEELLKAVNLADAELVKTNELTEEEKNTFVPLEFVKDKLQDKYNQIVSKERARRTRVRKNFDALLKEFEDNYVIKLKNEMKAHSKEIDTLKKSYAASKEQIEGIRNRVKELAHVEFKEKGSDEAGIRRMLQDKTFLSADYGRRRKEASASRNNMLIEDIRSQAMKGNTSQFSTFLVLIRLLASEMAYGVGWQEHETPMLNDDKEWESIRGYELPLLLDSLDSKREYLAKLEKEKRRLLMKNSNLDRLKILSEQRTLEQKGYELRQLNGNLETRKQELEESMAEWLDKFKSENGRDPRDDEKEEINVQAEELARVTENLEKAKEDLEALENQKSSLRTQLINLNFEIEREFVESEKLVVDKTQLIDRLLEENYTLLKRINEMRTERGSYFMRMNMSTSEEIRTLLSELEPKKAIVQSLEGELQNLNFNLKYFKEKAEELIEQGKQLMSSNEEGNKINELKEKYTELESTSRQCSISIKDNGALIDQLQADKEELEAQLAEREKMAQTFVDDIMNVEDKIASVAANINNIKTKISQYEKNLEKTEKKNEEVKENIDLKKKEVLEGANKSEDEILYDEVIQKKAAAKEDLQKTIDLQKQTKERLRSALSINEELRNVQHDINDTESAYNQAKEAYDNIIEEFESVYKTIEKERVNRKSLQNTITEMKDNILVFVKSTANSPIDGPLPYTKPVDQYSVSIPSEKKEYFFNMIYDETAKPADIYASSRDQYQTALKGFPVNLVLYGTDKSNRTEMLFGPGDSDNHGLIGLILQPIFETVSKDNSIKFTIAVSAASIDYQKAHDLLSEEGNEITDAHRDQTGITLYDNWETVSVVEYADVHKVVEDIRGKLGEAIKDLTTHIRVSITQQELATGKRISGHISFTCLPSIDNTSGHESVQMTIDKFNGLLFSLAKGETMIPFAESLFSKLMASTIAGNSRCILLCAFDQGDTPELITNVLKTGNRARYIRCMPHPHEDSRAIQTLEDQIKQIIIQNDLPKVGNILFEIGNQIKGDEDMSDRELSVHDDPDKIFGPTELVREPVSKAISPKSAPESPGMPAIVAAVPRNAKGHLVRK